MISIIMPTYNCAPFITDAIKSILLQSFDKYELIIIDDGSIDDTKKIVNRIKDGRIKYFEKEHSGLGDSIDYGIKKASFDLIARMDADDIAHPDRLLRQFNFLSLHTEIDILSNWYAAFKEDKIRYIVKRSVNHSDIVKHLSLYSDICHPSLLIKKRALPVAGSFKVNNLFDPFGDYVVWLRNKSKLKYHNLPEVLHFYRERSDSLSNETLANRRDIIYDIQQPYYEKNLFDEFGLATKEELIARGWREFLYGDIDKSFFYWRQLKIDVFKYPSIMAATVLRFFPNKILKSLYGRRIPNRLMYLINYFFSLERETIKNFRKTINAIECLQLN